MFGETLGAIAAPATAGSFILEAVEAIYRLVRRSACKRMGREGVGESPDKNE